MGLISDLAPNLAGRERGDSEAGWDELMPAYQDLAANVDWAWPLSTSRRAGTFVHHQRTDLFVPRTALRYLARTPKAQSLTDKRLCVIGVLDLTERLPRAITGLRTA